ncbi:hypothetical protein PIIN_02978 [Serendipita indica DSM 11827]|uniref:Serine protease n=1 Tax=Serendipita indica (strain DSM 11827) TaxID=1109443 RepID=G4U2D5_SERID|nr:hypothetical protein PIIN_02978 [Serendipita indica DSM 11827]
MPSKPQHNAISKLDQFLLSKLSDVSSGTNRVATLIHQYESNRGKEIKANLAAEPHPSPSRAVRTTSTACPVVLVAHLARSKTLERVCVSSGFRVETNRGDPCFITCAHTLEELRSTKLVDGPRTASNTLIMTNDGRILEASGCPSSLPRHDLLVLHSKPGVDLPTLPVSPYPAPIGTEVAIHCLHENPLPDEGWTPAFGGLIYRKWFHGHITDYRDFAGNQAKPGTYDVLANVFFSQIPTPGSSGGPIIDIQTGAVVGTIRGSQLDNRLTGIRGWGTSAESIYEMFVLPGIHLHD